MPSKPEVRALQEARRAVRKRLDYEKAVRSKKRFDCIYCGVGKLAKDFREGRFPSQCRDCDNEQAKYRSRTIRRKRGISYHLNWIIRTGFKGMVRYKVYAERLLPYTLSDLRLYIEQHPNFIVGNMSWQQYLDGDVVIDHVVPMAAFDLSSANEFSKCWALSNLQPLTHADNQRKSY